MAKLESIRIDNASRWFTYYVDPTGGKDIEFRVSSKASPAFKSAQRNLARRFTRSAPGARFTGNLPDKDLKMMQLELALCLLHDWRGVEVEVEGKLVDDKFTKDRAREVLSDDCYSDVVDFIHECAQDLSAFNREVVDEAVGN